MIQKAQEYKTETIPFEIGIVSDYSIKNTVWVRRDLPVIRFKSYESRTKKAKNQITV